MIKVTVLDDYQGIVARLDAVNVLEGLDIDLDVMTHHIEDESALARVLAKTDCLVLIRERTQISASLIAAGHGEFRSRMAAAIQSLRPNSHGL